MSRRTVQQQFRERVWTPPGRDSRQLRNARVKLIGSAILLALLVVAAIGLLA